MCWSFLISLFWVMGGAMSKSRKAEASLIPSLRYECAPAAITWLCDAFGFEELFVVPGETDGEIAHAQLKFGDSMLMLGSVGKHGGGFDDRMTTPSQAGGRSTQSVYVVVADPRAHCERAVSAGAEIVMPLEKMAYGGSGYSCLDLEGHLWSFGDYGGQTRG